MIFPVTFFMGVGYIFGALFCYFLMKISLLEKEFSDGSVRDNEKVDDKNEEIKNQPEITEHQQKSEEEKCEKRKNFAPLFETQKPKKNKKDKKDEEKKKNEDDGWIMVKKNKKK